MTEKELILKIVHYFESNIFEKHIQASVKVHSKLKLYNINPIVVKYLSKVLEDKFSPLGIAKALYYPRVLRKFTDTIRLAKTNQAFKNLNNDFIVGVLYGEVDELSMNYKIIDKIHPVYIGRDFWNRITGFPRFYDQLVSSLNDSILKI